MEATILYGNGLNLLSTHPVNWEKLLKNLADAAKTKLDTKNKPYTMAYEELFLGNKTMDEDAIKQHVIKCIQTTESNRFYDEMYDLQLMNYLTTNYDYTFEKVFKSNGFSYNLAQNKERIYSIRTSVNIANTAKTKIWHIHGDIERYHSISLGLDQYCGAISKIDGYLKGKGDYSQIKPIRDKIEKRDPFDNISWIELFFTTDIHIIGQGMDFSETDLWWILDKRARFQKTLAIPLLNKIYYYDKDSISDPNSELATTNKKQLLSAFGVEYVSLKMDRNNWEKLYEDIFKKLRKTIIERKKII